MRLLSIEARDFLSFEAFQLDRLDEGLSLIVGPNGAGKSNLLRVLDAVTLGLGWADFDNTSLAALSKYEAAMRHGADGHTFWIRVGVECTEEWEQGIWLSLLRAAVISNLLDRSAGTGPNLYQDPASQLQLDEHVVQTVTEQDVAPLLRGRVVLASQGVPSPSWAVGYEFDHGGATYCYVLQGGAEQSQIVAGPLPLPSTMSSGHVPLASRLLGDREKDSMSFSFAFERLLPDAGQSVVVETKPVRTTVPLSSLLGFASAARARELDRRSYTGAVVLREILGRSLSLISDQRVPPRHDYEPEELGTRPSLRDASAVPLELFGLKEGDAASRALYRQARKLFRDLTGQDFDLRTQAAQGAQASSVAQLVPQQGQDGSLVVRAVAGSTEPGVVIRIEPQVVGADSREVPILFAGAGLWEALVMSTALTGPPGRVVVLDEPAVNLHPTQQRRLLRHILEDEHRQVIVVTHSPYLVPSGSADDLHRIVRLTQDQAGTRARRLPAQADGDGGSTQASTGDRWRQILAASTDARGALFAQAVVLVEGDTELGLFERWLPATKVASADRSLAPDALNVMILPVGGDRAFGTCAGYLDAFEIPWAIVCDGPVLCPEYKAGTPLVDQLGLAGTGGTQAAFPADPADFPAWKQHWAQRGVFTLAERFGGLKKNDKDKSGEIEAFLSQVDAGPWQAAQAEYPKSKVRAAHHFAEHVSCPPQVDELYRQILTRLGLRAEAG